MKSGIYKIVNKVNGKIYVGQSIDIKRRWRSHKFASKTGNTHLYRSFRKYGLDNFEFIIIALIPKYALNQYEISYINYYSATDQSKGYNLTCGGEYPKVLLKEHRQNISKTNKGHKCSEETKKRISESNAGKRRSEETKQKMSYIKKEKFHIFQRILQKIK